MPVRRRPRASARKAARRPDGYAARTVTVKLKAPFEEWVAECRADFPLRVFQDLNSGDIDRVLPALDRIVLEHNFPDETGELATALADVDPPDAVTLLVEGLSEEVGKLPPR
jgi:hypothetical protein